MILMFIISTTVYGESSLYTVNATPHLNVRSLPNVESEVVGKVIDGQAVRIREVASEKKQVSGKSGRWVKIEYGNSNFGYVFDAFLEKTSTESYSFKMYKEGNTEYRLGNYYSAIKYYHLALDNAENEVERIKVLGALSQISKKQGNIELAKGYAGKILELDGKNEFATEILSTQQHDSQSVYNSSTGSYGQNSSVPNKNHTCSERTTICLALTWGPDVCSASFNEYADRELDSKVNDIITSPVCLVAISGALDEDYSQTDIELAVLTGALDEIGKAGVDSDNFFGKLFGGLSYIYSHSIKYSLYKKCMKSCI